MLNEPFYSFPALPTYPLQLNSISEFPAVNRNALRHMDTFKINCFYNFCQSVVDNYYWCIVTVLQRLTGTGTYLVPLSSIVLRGPAGPLVEHHGVVPKSLALSDTYRVALNEVKKSDIQQLTCTGHRHV